MRMRKQPLDLLQSIHQLLVSYEIKFASFLIDDSHALLRGSHRVGISSSQFPLCGLAGSSFERLQDFPLFLVRQLLPKKEEVSKVQKREIEFSGFKLRRKFRKLSEHPSGHDSS